MLIKGGKITNYSFLIYLSSKLFLPAPVGRHFGNIVKQHRTLPKAPSGRPFGYKKHKTPQANFPEKWLITNKQNNLYWGSSSSNFYYI